MTIFPQDPFAKLPIELRLTDRAIAEVGITEARRAVQTLIATAREKGLTIRHTVDHRTQENIYIITDH